MKYEIVRSDGRPEGQNSEPAKQIAGTLSDIGWGTNRVQPSTCREPKNLVVSQPPLGEQNSMRCMASTSVSEMSDKHVELFTEVSA